MPLVDGASLVVAACWKSQRIQRQLLQTATPGKEGLMLPAPPQAVSVARRRFLEDRLVPEDLVPRPILRSWVRCSGLGLDMASPPRVEPVTASELRELRERHDWLRRACRPEIEALRAEAASTDSIVILTDASGMVLDTRGSANFADRAARVALRPGVAWSESRTGTNAIGAAIADRRAVEVRGAEHYFELHRILSCSAVPIIDPRGELVGVLDLSGHASVHHLHALGLVRLAVDQIEHRFFEQGFEHCHVLRFHTDQALLGTPREGVFVFEDDRLVAANRHGAALLDVGSESLIERRFGELFVNGLTRLDERCRLRSHRGNELHGRLHRPTERAVAKIRAHPENAVPVPEPWFDETTLASRRSAARLLDANIPILLQGETGVGKEVFARQVYAHSTRCDKPFVAVNCAALPESLIESELFGYEEGAFTGARRHGAKGLLRQADTGVLFLDEIGDMPPALQARLLRVLQEREVTPLGGRPVAVDFAVICATHRNLRDLIAAGAFRSDLYFRIAQFTVELPSVRTLGDRAALIRTLWAQLGGTEAKIALAAASLDLLAEYDWPGNFRQLVGTLRALVVLGEPNTTLTPERLPREVRDTCTPAANAASGSCVIRPALCSEIKRLDEMTKQTMRQALAISDGNVSQAARRLGINRSTLYRRLLNETTTD
jgi:sigma-54 dependent transcriptional regulator, acetoin dehydrogenase operon transcriptional activator AcoR